ncbi:MAG: polysaccharide deacetylase family protein [Alphaproteobacteria bacterium]|nr:polysaccharide deacetylase family protein [Alphaproteobacteria bacterium]
MLKRALKQAIVASGLDRAARAVAGGPGAVLMFHQVGPALAGGGWSANEGLTTDPEVLAGFFDTLLGEGYQLVTATDAARRLRRGEGGRFAALTFDDGYRDNHDLLLPILERYGARATVYVATGFIDRTAPMWWFGVERAVAENDRVVIRTPNRVHEFATATADEKTARYETIRRMFYGFAPAETRAAVEGLKRDFGIDCHEIADRLSMDWSDVRALDRSGLVEIGGHTASHGPLAAMTEAEAWGEIDGGRRRIAAMTGRAPLAFAYPYGIAATVSERDIGLAAKAGFESAVTTESRPLRSGDAERPHALPRIALGGDDDWVTLRVRIAGLGFGRAGDAGWYAPHRNAEGPASRPSAATAGSTAA